MHCSSDIDRYFVNVDAKLVQIYVIELEAVRGKF
jgi:hypothetical protein